MFVPPQATTTKYEILCRAFHQGPVTLISRFPHPGLIFPGIEEGESGVLKTVVQRDGDKPLTMNIDGIYGTMIINGHSLQIHIPWEAIEYLETAHGKSYRLDEFPTALLLHDVSHDLEVTHYAEYLGDISEALN